MFKIGAALAVNGVARHRTKATHGNMILKSASKSLKTNRAFKQLEHHCSVNPFVRENMTNECRPLPLFAAGIHFCSFWRRKRFTKFRPRCRCAVAFH